GGAAAGDVAVAGRAPAGEVDHGQPCGDAGGVEAARAGGAQRHGRAGPRGAGAAALRGAEQRRGGPGAGGQAVGGGQPLRSGPEATQRRVPGHARWHRGNLRMSDNNPSAGDPFGQIADEFVEALRQGKGPSVEEFARRYPAHAEEIREMLPALVLVEKAKSAD